MRNRWVFVALLLVLALVVGAALLGCGGSSPDGSVAPPEAPSTQPTDAAPSDTTPPVTYADYPEGWTEGPVTVKLSVEDDSCSPSECAIYYSTDGMGSWETGDKVTLKQQGKQRIYVYAEDASGNKEEASYCELRIDNGHPATKALNSPTVQKGKSVALKYRINDKTPRVTAFLRLTGPQNKTINLGSEPTGKQRSVSLKANLPAGTYAWVVYAKDQAGNKATERASGHLVIKAKPSPPPRRPLVGITESGECYHTLSCYHWTKDPAGNSKVTVSEAQAMGLRPCSVCGPPY